MSHFINLSSRVINKLHIIEIIKYPSTYYIYMSNNYISGTFVFSFGGIKSDHNIITISAKDDKQDYDTITELIKNNLS
jgi:hypothetical protein